MNVGLSYQIRKGKTDFENTQEKVWISKKKGFLIDGSSYNYISCISYTEEKSLKKLGL